MSGNALYNPLDGHSVVAAKLVGMSLPTRGGSACSGTALYTGLSWASKLFCRTAASLRTYLRSARIIQVRSTLPPIYLRTEKSHLQAMTSSSFSSEQRGH